MPRCRCGHESTGHYRAARGASRLGPCKDLHCGCRGFEGCGCKAAPSDLHGPDCRWKAAGSPARQPLGLPMVRRV